MNDTAHTLSAALETLNVDMDDPLGRDVGLDTTTQRESLQLHVKTDIAADLAKKSDFDQWRHQLASEPRETRRTHRATPHN